MPNPQHGDDIRDLMARYGTGSLSGEEQNRLFSAALDNQELFNELVREQEIQNLLEVPGARARLIDALQPPKSRAWMFGLAAVVASALVVIVLLWPVPKPRQIAVRAPAPALEVAPVPTLAPPPVKLDQPAAADKPVPQVPRKKEAAPVANEVKDAAKIVPEKAHENAAPKKTAPAAAPTPLPAMQRSLSSGSSAGAQAMFGRVANFGFHYSIQTKGHLIVIPSNDGYLSVKSGTGAVLYATSATAAGILVDVPLPASATSIVITFSAENAPVTAPPVVHAEPEATVQGNTPLAINLKLQP